MAKAKYIRFLQTTVAVTAAILLLLAVTAATPASADDETRPTIALNPRKGPVGTKLYITLTDFEPGTIDISFDAESNVVETDSTDDNGDLYTYIIIEEYPAGKYKIWATDNEDNQEITYFTVAADVELDDTSGYVGDEIIVDGTGFAASSEVGIYFDGDEVAIDKTNEDGTFTGATFYVPESFNGTHTVKAVDEDDNHCTTGFLTHQSIAISDKSGAVGTGVTVSGTGFAADSDLTIIFGNDEISTSQTDENGSFSNTFVVPAMVKGDYRIKITDGTNNEFADFGILSATTLSPTTGHVGTEVTVSGAGFTPNATIGIKYDGTQVVKTTTDANGTFEANFSVPVSEQGDHTVLATDTANTGEMVFTMESDAPPAAQLLLPASATKVSQTPQFSWEPVTDPSGVTYSLQVASDSNFSELVLQKSGLTDTGYIVTEGERFPPAKKQAPYYWRVRAIDRASNAGGWSGAGSFYMGITLAAPPGWIQWGLTGLGITLFGFLFGTFLNRLRRLAIGD